MCARRALQAQDPLSKDTVSWRGAFAAHRIHMQMLEQPCVRSVRHMQYLPLAALLVLTACARSAILDLMEDLACTALEAPSRQSTAPQIAFLAPRGRTVNNRQHQQHVTTAHLDPIPRWRVMALSPASVILVTWGLMARRAQSVALESSKIYQAPSTAPRVGWDGTTRWLLPSTFRPVSSARQASTAASRLW